MQKREFFFFEWVVVDNCNLDCSYCINKGEFSQKSKDKMKYVPGLEISIAQKIVELSDSADRVYVNLTGGDPLLSDYFIDVLKVLASAGNITVNLITNLKRINRYADDIVRVFPALAINGSLHISFRSDHEIDNLIDFLNAYKSLVSISLSQVDYELTYEDRRKLALITNKTGMNIALQTYIPPWTDAGKIDNSEEILNSNFISSKGKRCCLGFSHFFLLPDGTFYYDLWCNDLTNKSGNFLGINPANFGQFILDDMKKCPMSFCGCNYNTSSFLEYITACNRLGYDSLEVFSQNNQSILQHLKQKFYRGIASLRDGFRLKGE